MRRKKEEKQFWNGFTAFFLLFVVLCGAGAVAYSYVPQFQTIVKEYVTVEVPHEVLVPVEVPVEIQVPFEKTMVYLINNGVTTKLEPNDTGKIILPSVNDPLFLGWYNGETQVTNDTIYSTSAVVVAKYQVVMPEVPTPSVVLTLNPYTNDYDVMLVDGSVYVLPVDPVLVYGSDYIQQMANAGVQIVGLDYIVNNQPYYAPTVDLSQNPVIKIIPRIEPIMLQMVVVETRIYNDYSEEVVHNVSIRKGDSLQEWFNNFLQEQLAINPNYQHTGAETLMVSFNDAQTVSFTSHLIVENKEMFSFKVHFIDEIGNELYLFNENFFENYFATSNYFSATWVGENYVFLSAYSDIDLTNQVDISWFDTNPITQNYEFWVIVKEAQLQENIVTVHYIDSFTLREVETLNYSYYGQSYLFNRQEIAANQINLNYVLSFYYFDENLTHSISYSWFNEQKIGNYEIYVKFVDNSPIYLTIDLTNSSHDVLVNYYSNWVASNPMIEYGQVSLQSGFVHNLGVRKGTVSFNTLSTQIDFFGIVDSKITEYDVFAIQVLEDLTVRISN